LLENVFNNIHVDHFPSLYRRHLSLTVKDLPFLIVEIFKKKDPFFFFSPKNVAPNVSLKKTFVGELSFPPLSLLDKGESTPSLARGPSLR